MYVPVSETERELIGVVDAANDCYAGWKVFQMLEKFRMEGQLEMPQLIDYRDEVEKKNQKTRRRLLDAMRCLKAEGGRSMAIFNDLISIRRTRLDIWGQRYSTQFEVLVEESREA